MSGVALCSHLSPDGGVRGDPRGCGCSWAPVRPVGAGGEDVDGPLGPGVGRGGPTGGATQSSRCPEAGGCQCPGTRRTACGWLGLRASLAGVPQCRLHGRPEHVTGPTSRPWLQGREGLCLWPVLLQSRPSGSSPQRPLPRSHLLVGLLSPQRGGSRSRSGPTQAGTGQSAPFPPTPHRGTQHPGPAPALCAGARGSPWTLPAPGLATGAPSPPECRSPGVPGRKGGGARERPLEVGAWAAGGRGRRAGAESWFRWGPRGAACGGSGPPQCWGARTCPGSLSRRPGHDPARPQPAARRLRGCGGHSWAV